MDQVEEIKSKVDIVDIIQEYVPLKRAGRNFRALCPFHTEKTASFMVSPELQIFKCFGCNLGGDVYQFLMQIEGIEFPEALRYLAKRTGVKLAPFRGERAFAERERLYQINHLASEFYHYLLKKHPVGKVALEYLAQKRGATGESLEVFKIGFAPQSPDALIRFLTQKKDYKIDELDKAGLIVRTEGKNFDRFRGRVIFPLRDHRGNTLGFAARILPQDEGKDLAKYVNTPETPIYQKRRHLYGLEVSREDIKKEGRAITVEGELDLISSWQAGIRNIVAIKGSVLTEEQVGLLSRFTQELVLALDTDIAGDTAARRGIEIAQLEGLTVKVAELGEFKDPDEAALKNPQKFKRLLEGAVGVYDFLINSAFSRFDVRTGEGKAKISREFVPILAGIPDKIVQAHYIAYFADRLGVSQEAVAAQVEELSQIEKRPQVIPEEKEILPAKTRREILEEYLLTLLLQGRPEAFLAEEIATLLKTPHLARLREEFVDFYEKGEFDPAKFAQKLPGELVEPFATLILSDVSYQLSDPKNLEREIEKTKKGIKVLGTKELLNKLSQEIKELEAKGGKKLEEVQKEFVVVSSQLSTLEEQG